MEVHERLRLLRQQLGLSTRAFGAGIHLSGSAITNMEQGLRTVTPRTAADICRRYHVRQEWLLDGQGEMLADPAQGLEVSDEVRQLAERYLRLSPQDRELIRRLVDSLAEKAGRQ